MMKNILLGSVASLLAVMLNSAFADVGKFSGYISVHSENKEVCTFTSYHKVEAFSKGRCKVSSFEGELGATICWDYEYKSYLKNKSVNGTVGGPSTAPNYIPVDAIGFWTDDSMQGNMFPFALKIYRYMQPNATQRFLTTRVGFLEKGSTKIGCVAGLRIPK